MILISLMNGVAMRLLEQGPGLPLRAAELSRFRCNVKRRLTYKPNTHGICFRSTTRQVRMAGVTRREFLAKATADAAVAALVAARVTGLRAAPLGVPVGWQTWEGRTLVAKGFPGIIQLLAEGGLHDSGLCPQVRYAASGCTDGGH